jgi:NAD(P)-dependent dehydrogenase (short-subunit alcohol dehydrogenase family)
MGASTSGQHAAGGMVKSLALQVAADGIALNAVLPAGVDTHVIHKKAM